MADVRILDLEDEFTVIEIGGGQPIIEIAIDEPSIQFIEVAPVGITGPPGPEGPIGPQGPVGPGVDDGGTPGQILTKASTTDYDTRWSDPAISGHTVQDEGSSLTARTVINFTGGGVATTDDPGTGRTIVTIPLGETFGAVAAHEAAPDPHPQYLTQAEGDATLAAHDASAGAHGALRGTATPTAADALSGTTGAAAKFAREDHKHTVSTASPISLGSANAPGSAATLARSDHVHMYPTAPQIGAEPAGTVNTHNTSTTSHSALRGTITPIAADSGVGVIGTSAKFAHEDHKHQVSTAPPVALGPANAPGSATSLARSDHVHAYPSAAQTGAEPAGAVSAHEALANPHPVYLTQAEADALYATTGGTGGHTIQDEGATLAERATLNFTGAGVTATDDLANNRIVIDIPGGAGTGGHTIQDEGTPLAAQPTLNFLGSGITVTDNPASTRTDVTVPVQTIVSPAAPNPAGLPEGTWWVDEDSDTDATGVQTVQDEGTLLAARTVLNFVGDGVTATDDAANERTVVTIPGGGGAGSTFIVQPEPPSTGLPEGTVWIDEDSAVAPGAGGGHTVQDEGTPLTARAGLNFIGTGVTATDDAANDRTTITISAEAAGAVAAHEAAADPHAQYLTQTEADALYTAAGVTSGSLILSGTAAPTAGDGATGDYYLDTDDNILYGPKLSSAGAVQNGYASKTPTTTWSPGGAATVRRSFTFAKAGTVTGLRYYRHSASTSTSRVLKLWTTGGSLLATATTSGDSGTGWKTAMFGTPYAVTAGQTLAASWYSASNETHGQDSIPGVEINGDITMGSQTTYSYSGDVFPNDYAGANDFFIDVIYQATVTDPWPVALTSASGNESTILSGTATPADGTGATGDYYLDTDDRILYGPKVTAVGGFGPPQSVYTSQSHTEQPALGDWCMGNDFVFAVGGRITGLRFNSNYTTYQDKSLSVWTTGGVLLGTVIPVAAGVVGWQSGMFATPIAITAGQTVRVVLNAPVVGLLRRAPNFASDIVNGDVTMLKQAYYVAMPDTTPVFPTTPGTSTYFSDVIFEAGTAPNNPWPVALKSVPPGGTTSQVLAKTDATDYAAAWVAAPAGLQTRATATKTTASLAHTASETGTISLANGYRLYSITCSAPCRVRLYTTAAKRDADTARAIGVDPSGDHGLQFEFVATNPDLAFDLTPLVDGFDGKATPDGIIPITITNMSGAAAAITVQLLYLRTE